MTWFGVPETLGVLWPEIGKLNMEKKSYRDAGLAAAGDLETGRSGAILPVGSFEPHGSNLPLCTDTYVASAFARMVGERCSYAVFPPLCYTPAETTRLLHPTVSVRSDAFIPYLRSVCEEILRQRFAPLILMSIHRGNEPALTIVIQELLREHASVAAHFDPLSLGMRTCATDIAPEADAPTWETSLLCGALSVLELPNMASDDTRAKTASSKTSSSKGKVATYVGHAYESVEQHIPTRAPLAPQLIRQFMESVADAIAAACRDLERESTRG